MLELGKALNNLGESIRRLQREWFWLTIGLSVTVVLLLVLFIIGLLVR